MKINLLACFTMLIAFSTYNNCFGQFIQAGMVSQNDIYTDVDPDSSIIAEGSHFTGYLGGQIDIDLDQNGTFDFRFYADGGGGLGGGGTKCILKSLDANNRIITHPDTSMGYPGIQYIVNVPDSLNYGDSIHNSSNFNHDYSYIWSYTYGALSDPKVEYWNNIGDHFIGVCITELNDTLYGWIRINVSQAVVLFTLSIKDYACNKNLNSVKDHIDLLDFNIHPNPAVNKTKISSQVFIQNGNIIVLSSNGSILWQERLHGNSKCINLENLNKGIYFLKIETGQNSIIKKIIKN